MKGKRGLVLSLCGLAVGIVALPALILGTNAIFQRTKLEGYRTELAAKGEKLRIAQLAPPPHVSGTSEGEELIKIADSVSRQLESLKIKPVSSAILDKSGQAEIAHLRATARRAGVETSWENFEKEITPFRPYFAELRVAAQLEELHLRGEYSQETAMPMKYLVPTLRAGQQLAAENILLLREGKISTAVENVGAMLKLAAMLSEVPTMISQMVSTTITGLAFFSTWEILQCEPSRPDLQGLFSAWERLRPGENLAATLRVERAWFHTELNAKNPQPDVENSPFPKPSPQAIFLWKLCCRDKDERQTLEDYQSIIEACSAGKPWADILTQSNALIAAARDSGLSRLQGSQTESIVFGRIRMFPESISLQTLSLTAIAIRLYQRDHGNSLPDNLGVLVPNYLKQVPLDPMDGQPLRYHVMSSNFKLYAIGADYRDELGDTSSRDGKLLGIVDRRDIVWPQAVSAAPAK